LSLVCKNCKAIYKGKISPYSRFVKCTYCDSVIVVPSTEHKTDTARLANEKNITCKEFSTEQFEAFLVKKGIKTFDKVSGILKFGNQEVVVDQDGTISGPEPLRSRVEKWLHKFMS
jgi:repressor of nif and glnA expression